MLLGNMLHNQTRDNIRSYNKDDIFKCLKSCTEDKWVGDVMPAIYQTVNFSSTEG
jgi:hypothetical protein